MKYKNQDKYVVDVTYKSRPEKPQLKKRLIEENICMNCGT